MNTCTKPRILLIEDDTAISRALTLRLASAGYEVTAIDDGTDATQIVRSMKPDLIILDVNLPSGDGFDVAESIRKERQCVPILFITALRGARHVPEIKGLDNTWYLEKPFTTPFLIHTIKQAISGGTGVDRQLQSAV